MTQPQPTKPKIGQNITGYEVPVINERAVRGAAGILFLLGMIAMGAALITDSVQPLQPFGMFFMLDMLTRVTFGDRFSPTLAIARVIVRKQQPEWVGAEQKGFAWWLGLGIAIVSCSAMGLFAAPLWLTAILCGLCLSLLYLETAFGICVGCALHQRFSKRPTLYCPGGTCEMPAQRASIN